VHELPDWSGDLEVTTPVTVGSTTVEIAGEIATTGEWFSIAVVVKDTAILGQYDITGKITTSAGRVIKYCIHAIIKTC
jgi:hypothetical protein